MSILKSRILYLFSALALLPLSNLISQTDQSTTQLEKEILVRKVADDILTYLGDTISRVEPVEMISAESFRVTFSHPFTFETDAIVSIIDHALHKSEYSGNYLASLQDCKTRDVLFGFSMNEEEGDVVPCGGRSYDEQCYALQITFSEAVVTNLSAQNGNPWIALITLGVLAFFIYLFYRGKPFQNLEQKDDLLAPPFIKVGKYMYFPDSQSLIIEEHEVSLTDKENQILLLFVNNMNTILKREVIQKEVWENEGVIVGRSLDMFISKLRKKLELDPNIKIKNIHGKGYMLRA